MSEDWRFRRQHVLCAIPLKCARMSDAWSACVCSSLGRAQTCEYTQSCTQTHCFQHQSFLWTAGLWLDHCGFTRLIRMTGNNAVFIFSWLRCRLICRGERSYLLQYYVVVYVLATYIKIYKKVLNINIVINFRKKKKKLSQKKKQPNAVKLNINNKQLWNTELFTKKLNCHLNIKIFLFITDILQS